MYRLSPNMHLLLVLILVTTTGCHPTQPFYLHDDRDLSHYLEKAQQVEHADVNQPHLAEVDQARDPITLSNPEFDSLWDLTLQECMHIALANAKVIRGGGTPRIQSGQIFAGTQDGALADTPQAFTTVFNPAIRESGVGGESGVGVEAALSAFDTQFRMFGSQGNNAIYNKTDRPQNVPLNNALPVNSALDSGGLITQFAKRAATGTTFTALNQTDYSRGERFDSQPLSSFWTTAMEMRVDQPLGRGKGEQVNRAPVIIARTQTDVELANLEDQLQKMVANIEIRYWDLQRGYRDLEAAKIGRDTTLTAWRKVYANIGSTGAQAEAQAREQYFAFRAAVEQTLRELHNSENQLRLLMGIAATDGRLIRPIDEPSLARVQFDWNQILVEALVKRPELRLRKWEIKRREMELIIARNQLLPQVDVGVAYRFVGVGDELATANGRGIVFPNVGSTAVEEMLDGNFQEVGMTLNVQQAIGFRRELAGVRNAQLNLARERAYLEDMELDISHNLTLALRNLDANYNLAQTHYNRLNAAQNDVDAAQVAYEESVTSEKNRGRDPLDALLDATRRRSQAQQAYYQAILEYNKSITDIHMKKGSVLEYCGISFEEGPWTRKAYWDALARARERDAGKYMDYGWTRPKVVSLGTTDSLGVHTSDGAPNEPLLDSVEATSPEELPTPEPAEATERLPNELGPEAKAPRSSSNGLRTAAASPTWGNLETTAQQKSSVASGVVLASYGDESNEANEEEIGSTRPHHSAARHPPRRSVP
jgi:outer membrane protein TolC